MNQPLPTESRADKELFFEALDLSAVGDRNAFLERACAGDPAKRRRLEALLANHFQRQVFMVDPAVENSPGLGETLGEELGTMIGRYKLLEKLGEGGFGTVYVAEQKAPVKRRVALKIIKLGMDTRQVVARFEAERQALAMMDHPNIARVFDAGATETGRPYFVMELVRGTLITRYSEENRFPINERLKLFVQVCLAIQHAHQKGIIHRDIKPSNILVTLHDGVPVPKVIDFGIAKAVEGDLTDKTLYTHYHQFIGTPAYMSPEQAEMSGLNVDTRTDIYALGVLLYELLTGHTPFESKELLQSGLEEMRKTIREKEPMRPSTRLRQGPSLKPSPPARALPLATDLDWIVMKCLEKDRTRRYATANELADDIQRHLDNEPISARAPTALYQLGKFARRHRVATLTIALIVISLVSAMAFMARQAAIANAARREAVLAKEQETRERLRADIQKRLAERNFYLASRALAQLASDKNLLSLVGQTLDETASNPHRGFEWYYQFGAMNRHARAVRAHAPGGLFAIWSADGLRFASAGHEGVLKLWEASTGRELHACAGHAGPIHSFAYSPNSRLIATAGQDRTTRVWDAQTGKELHALPHPGIVWFVTFSPDSQRILTGDGTVRMWDANSGAMLREMGPGVKILYSPDSKRLAVSTGRGIVIHDAVSGEKIGHDEEPAAWIAWMTYSRDGNKLVATYDDGSIQLLDGRTVQRLALFKGHAGIAYSAAISPDGGTFATSDEQAIRFWDATTFRHLFTIKVGAATSLTFSPDGRQLLGGCSDGTLRVWAADESSSGEPARLASDLGVYSARFSKDGKQVLGSSGELWNGENRDLIKIFGDGKSSSSARFFPDGKRVITIAAEGIARIWDIATQTELVRFEGHPKEQLYTLAISPDGQRVFTASSSQSWDVAVNLIGKLWDAASGKEIVTLKGVGKWAVFFPDGRRLATGSDKGCNIWNLSTGQVERTLPAFGGPVALSSDGRRVVAAEGKRAQIWDSQTGAVVAAIYGHTGVINSVEFSHDDRRVVTGSDDDTVRLWDSETGKEVLTLTGGRGRISTAEFSADDQRIVAAAKDEIVIWEAASPEELARARYEGD